MKKCLMFMLVIAVVSCGKKEVAPVPDTVIEGIKGNVKVFDIEQYNLEFDSYDKTTENFDKDGFLTTVEYGVGEVIDDEASDEYFIDFSTTSIIKYGEYGSNNTRSGESINVNGTKEYSVVRSWIKPNEYKEIINYMSSDEYTTTVTWRLNDKGIRVQKEEKKASSTVPSLISMHYVSFILDEYGHETSVTYKSEKYDKNAVTYKIVNGYIDSYGNVLERTFLDAKGETVKVNTYTYEYY